MGELALLFCAFVWSLAYFFSKSLLSVLSPNTAILYRYFLAGVCFLPFVRIAALRDKTLLFYGIFSGVILWLLLLVLYFGLQTGTITNAGFIVTLFIVFVPVLSRIFYGIKFGTLDIVAIVLSLLGLWLVTGGIDSLITADLLYLLTAVLSSVHVLVIERASIRIKSFSALCFVQCMTVAFCGFIYAAGTGEQFVIPSGRGLADLLYLAVLGSSITLWLQVYGQKRVSAWKSCLIYATEPLFTALCAWYLAGEVLGEQSFAGGLLIVMSIIIPKLRLPTALFRRALTKNPE